MSRTRVLTVTLNPSVDETLALDTLTPGALHRVAAARTDPGGKGVNVARVLTGFGVPVTATGFCGGETGRFLQTALAKVGVSVDFTAAPGATRINRKLRETSGRTTELNEMGAPIPPAALAALEQRLADLLPTCSLAVLAGSLPPGVPADYYATLIRLCRRYGVHAFLDADGEALAAGLKAGPFAVKPNRAEWERLSERPLATPADKRAALSALHGCGVTLAVISCGAEGALFSRDGRAVTAKPFPVTCRGTVGAGDTMVAALCYGLLHGFEMEKLAAFATAAGTLTAACEGTGVCTLAETQARYAEVAVTPLR